MTAVGRRGAEDVLRVLHESLDPLGGYDISRRARIRSGRLYPILQQLENEGRIGAVWIAGPYPRRRVYFIPKEWYNPNRCGECGQVVKGWIRIEGEPYIYALQPCGHAVSERPADA